MIIINTTATLACLGSLSVSIFWLPLWLIHTDACSFFPLSFFTNRNAHTHPACTHITDVMTADPCVLRRATVWVRALGHFFVPVCVYMCVCVRKMCCLNIVNSSGFFFAPWDPWEPQLKLQGKLRKRREYECREVHSKRLYGLYRGQSRNIKRRCIQGKSYKIL